MRGAWLAAAALTLTAGIAGCGADSSAEEGEATLTIYVSAPLTGPGRADGQDVADGARLALSDAGAEAGGYEIAAEYLDVAGRNESRFDAVTAAANARTATEDSTTIAYIGELDSGATRTSLPITNSAGILQVAPGSGASDLVTDETYNDDVPTEVQGTGERTFARTVPGDAEVGAAAARWIGSDFDVEAVAVDGEGEYGEVVLDAFRDEAATVGLDLRTDRGLLPGSAAFFARGAIGNLGLLDPGPRFGEGLGRGANRLLERAAEIPIFFTDAVFASSRRPPRSVFVASALLDPSQLSTAGHDFGGTFLDEYGREPGRYAAYGYEAMASILAAIDRADDPADRGSAVDAYLDGTERDSVLGTYEITNTGETALGRVSGYELTPSGRLDPIAELTSSP